MADQREAASLQRYNYGCIEGLDQAGDNCSSKACHTNSEFLNQFQCAHVVVIV